MNRIGLQRELDAQEQGPDTDLLRLALEVCATASEWRAMAVCKWVSTGPLSYQGRRVWTPSGLLIGLQRRFADIHMGAQQTPT